MASFRIAVIGGDGIGPEVIDEVELRLAEYVRAHREFFLALDREA